jgi:hypothetical protein
MVLLVALATPWLFPRTTAREFEALVEGAVAERDVIARVPFSVLKSPDQLAAEQRAAEGSVPTILARDPARADSASNRLGSLFATLDSVIPTLRRRAAADNLGAEARAELITSGLADVATAAGIGLPTPAQLTLLSSDDERRRIRQALEAEFDGRLRDGVVAATDLPEAPTASVVIREGTNDEIRTAQSILTMQAFYASASERVTGTLSSEGVTLFGKLLVTFAEPTLTLDVETMRERRAQNRQAVAEASGYVLQGERIITQHERIGQEEARRLQSYQNELVRLELVGQGTGFWRSLGMVFLAAAPLGILVFTTFSFRREIYEDLRSLSVIIVMILIVLAVAGIIASTGAPAALIPVALAALLIAALFDAFLAIVVVSAIAAILLGQSEFEGLAVPMLTAAGGVTAAFAVGEVRRRSQSWRLIALITAAYVGTGVCLLLIGRHTAVELLVTSIAGFGNATICTALAMGAVLPALEAFTRRTTEQTLLELADMNRPLLRRLAREAPGTYAHSINVANLVEAACAAIGADSLTARVGVYYHDIGKLQRPQYFIENQPKGLNPHDRLRPHQSAEILREHVRGGLLMAEEAKLPRVVKNFIREHHGTQKIEYFLARARKEEPDREIDPNDFCYPGPKPQSKETAIAMLGDAVEAASRTLTDPSPERIRALIQRLVRARVEDGQLDECRLTFRDLDRVKREFARVLIGLYHHRIDYPAPTADTLPQVPKPAAAIEAGPAASRPGGHASNGADDFPDPEGMGGEPASEQMSIELDQAAQSDTGPPPDLAPEPAPAEADAGLATDSWEPIGRIPRSD